MSFSCNTLQFTHSASLLCPCVSQGSFLLRFALVQSSLVRPNSQFSTSHQRKSHSRVVARRLYLSPCPDSPPMSPHSFLFTNPVITHATLGRTTHLSAPGPSASTPPMSKASNSLPMMSICHQRHSFKRSKNYNVGLIFSFPRFPSSR
jgi:hypothetical protein